MKRHMHIFKATFHLNSLSSSIFTVIHTLSIIQRNAWNVIHVTKDIEHNALLIRSRLFYTNTHVIEGKLCLPVKLGAMAEIVMSLEGRFTMKGSLDNKLKNLLFRFLFIELKMYVEVEKIEKSYCLCKDGPPQKVF